MMVTLLVSLVAVTLLYVTLMVFRTQLEWLRDENRALEERRSLEVHHV
jgi:hypothetical protein